MSLSSINPKSNASKSVKKRLGQDQVQLLESCFDSNQKLDPERKFQLARQLGVPPRQIAIWYQNKRARWRSQTLELDCGALEVRLDAALADKRRLEKEVCSLRGELKRAQEMMFAISRPAQADQAASWIPPVSSLSSCCDEGVGSSSLNDDVGWPGTCESLQFEELYEWLMMNGSESNYQ